MKKRRSKSQIWQEQLDKLSDQRERNVNRYIIPIEIKMQEIKDKLKNHYKLQ